jgi:hypothetical protein
MTLLAEISMVETFVNWLIPMTMAFLTVTLGDLWNRRLNIVLGGFHYFCDSPFNEMRDSAYL